MDAGNIRIEWALPMLFDDGCLAVVILRDQGDERGYDEANKKKERSKSEGHFFKTGSRVAFFLIRKIRKPSSQISWAHDHYKSNRGWAGFAAGSTSMT